MAKIKIEELKSFSKKALLYAGVKEEDANTVVDTLVTTDEFGVLSHGTKNLYQYIQKMQEGGLDAKAEPTVEAEGPAWAIINGNAAIGMVSACTAMKLAIEKAKECGIAYVGVKNSCHFGAAGYYANLAAKEGMIGISMSNADPNMAIPKASDRTNPIRLKMIPTALPHIFNNRPTIFNASTRKNTAKINCIILISFLF